MFFVPKPYICETSAKSMAKNLLRHRIARQQEARKINVKLFGNYILVGSYTAQRSTLTFHRESNDFTLNVHKPTSLWAFKSLLLLKGSITTYQIQFLIKLFLLSTANKYIVPYFLFIFAQQINGL